MQQSNYGARGIWNLGFPELAGPASEAKKGRGREKEQTTRSYIVH
jgi:hypothetical protein